MFCFPHGFRRWKFKQLKAGRTNVLTTRGQRSVPAGGLGRTAGNVVSEPELHRDSLGACWALAMLFDELGARSGLLSLLTCTLHDV